MIDLGRNQVSLYPNNGLTYNNNGGHIVFHGRCSIGNNSAIAIGKKGHVEFGKDFMATSTFRLASQYHIVFGDKVLFGWDCLVMDSDFHRLTKITGGYTKGYGAIKVGSNIWFGNGVLLLKNSQIPNYTVVGAKSVVCGKVDVSERSLVSGNPVTLKKRGVWLNPSDNFINYETFQE